MRGRCCRLLCAIAAATLTASVRADEFDTLNIALSTSLTYDSNVFRLPDATDAQTALGRSTKSDRISVSSLTLRLDKRLSQQRFQLDVSETVYRYDTFTFLNFEALEYRGAWLWHLTPRVSGTLGADRRKSLVPFGDIRAAQQSLRVADRQYFTLEGQLVGGWYALLGASHFEQRDSQMALSPEQSYEAVSGEAGVKYVAAPGTSLAVLQRFIEGKYENRIDTARLFDTGYRDDQTEVIADWHATGKSTFRGRLTRIDRQHDNFPQRDYDARAGEVTLLWSPTGKSRVIFTRRRDVSTWWEPLSSYRVSDLGSVSWTWQATHQVALVTQYDRVERDYRGPVVAPMGPLRVDYERSAQLAINWTPMRSLILRAGVQHHTRSSNFPGNDYDANVAHVSAELTF